MRKPHWRLVPGTLKTHRVQPRRCERFFENQVPSWNDRLLCWRHLKKQKQSSITTEYRLLRALRQKLTERWWSSKDILISWSARARLDDWKWRFRWYSNLHQCSLFLNTPKLFFAERFNAGHGCSLRNCLDSRHTCQMLVGLEVVDCGGDFE